MSFVITSRLTMHVSHMAPLIIHPQPSRLLLRLTRQELSVSQLPHSLSRNGGDTAYPSHKSVHVARCLHCWCILHNAYGPALTSKRDRGAHSFTDLDREAVSPFVRWLIAVDAVQLAQILPRLGSLDSSRGPNLRPSVNQTAAPQPVKARWQIAAAYFQ